MKNISTLPLALTLVYLLLCSNKCNIDVGMKQDIEQRVDEALVTVKDLEGTIHHLPEQLGNEARQTIAEFQATATTLLQTQTQLHKDAAGEVIIKANEEIDKTLSKNLEKANKMLGETVEGIKSISKVTIDSMGTVARVLGGTLDKNTDKIIFASEKATTNLKEIATQAGFTAKETTLLLTGELKLLVQHNMAMLDKILQARIRQLFKESTKLLKELDKIMANRITQLDIMLQNKIDVITWNTIVVGESMNDALKATFGQTGLMITRFIVIIFGLTSLTRFAFLYLNKKIALSFSTILPVLFLLIIGSLLFSDNLMFRLIGKEYMTVENFHKLSDDKYQKIQSAYEKGGMPNIEFCTLCEETIDITSKCQVLTSPDNNFRKRKYKERMENIYFVLSELGTKCF